VSEHITLRIDNTDVRIPEGSSILEAALSHKIYIPHICNDQTLKAFGGCRLCIVKVDGMKGMPAACTTQAAPGMNVTTWDADLDAVRRDTLELILSTHPDDCLSCTANLKCELQETIACVGSVGRQLRRMDTKSPVEKITPFFVYDREYCILCQKCVRVCDEVARKDFLAVINRGSESRVACFIKEEELRDFCPTCMQCVKHCPTAALR
jgi:predicted molibdopterin-dependent oxidoreductase YjgC